MRLCWLFIPLLSVVPVPPGFAWYNEIVSDFDVTNDLDGWHHWADAYGSTHNGTLGWQGTAGDGYMRLDIASYPYNEYYAAPSRFRGNWHTMKAAQISFDFRTDVPDVTGEENWDLDLVVVSDSPGTSGIDDVWFSGFSFHPEWPPARKDTWYTYTVSLEEANWDQHVGTKSWDELQSNVTDFVIEAWVDDGSQKNDFDNIKLQCTPELPPGGLLLLGAVPLGIAWWRRRRQTG